MKFASCDESLEDNESSRDVSSSKSQTRSVVKDDKTCLWTLNIVKFAVEIQPAIAAVG